MIVKKTFVLVGSLLILGVGFILAQEGSQAEVRNEEQKRLSYRFQVGPMFVDEDGDGICDFSRDHDNDGIPNCQDPDWTRPKDGTGYKNMSRKNYSSQQFKNRIGYNGGQGWNKASFRHDRANFGRGICDGLGPKSGSNRYGRR